MQIDQPFLKFDVLKFNFPFALRLKPCASSLRNFFRKKLLNEFFQLNDSFLKIRKLAGSCLRAQGTRIIKGRTSCNCTIRDFHGFGDAALRIDFTPVCNLDMSDDANLSANHLIFPKLGTARDPALGGDYRVNSYFNVMRNLDQVVELDTFFY